MISNLLKNVDKIYIAYGATDFRKQIPSLYSTIKNNFQMNPYNKSAYIFCNKKRDSIKVLCYDKNRICTSTKNIIKRQKNEILLATQFQ